jgi:1-acyl-sn-glycerol-3-phosphate acyltransferase
MRLFKISIILVSFIVYIVLGTILNLTLPWLMPKKRWRVMGYLTFLLINWIRRIAGIQVQVSGQTSYLKERGNILMSRHIGYIDGLVLGSLTPAIFVSKNDVKGWPLIGTVVEISGTIFIDRRHKNAIAESLQDIIERLKEKVNIIIFPEGTSTNGETILPFQTPFFSVPLASQASMIPIAIEYRTIDGKMITNPHDICWYGQVSFSRHLWRLLSFRHIGVHVTIYDKVKIENGENNSLARKDLAKRCHQLFLNLLLKKKHSLHPTPHPQEAVFPTVPNISLKPEINR